VGVKTRKKIFVNNKENDIYNQKEDICINKEREKFT